MAINIHKVDLNSWIRWATTESQTVVEFGSMFFERLEHVNGNRIGIEIYKPYIDAARFHECTKIQGDFRYFESLVSEDDMDCAMFVDSLEHITREEAFSLMSRVMDKFNKVIIMIPEGNHPMEQDETGYGGHEWQTHRSTWNAQDLVELGFEEKEITLDPGFHNHPERDTGCLFAVWSK
tara:strand:- start:1388 stop:1924 length:537 start_codon:yes stop_codon:yes gene_type:complete